MFVVIFYILFVFLFLVTFVTIGVVVFKSFSKHMKGKDLDVYSMPNVGDVEMVMEKSNKCSYCGSELKEDQKSCHSCGATIKK